jgi:hypothetical protein
MTITLTPDLARAVAAAQGQSVRLKDPNTNEDYVLIKAELFDRINHLMVDDEADRDMRQVGSLIEEAMREDDENDPLVQSYQNYQKK